VHADRIGLEIGEPQDRPDSLPRVGSSVTSSNDSIALSARSGTRIVADEMRVQARRRV
jgi:hypothetical protein